MPVTQDYKLAIVFTDAELVQIAHALIVRRDYCNGKDLDVEIGPKWKSRAEIARAAYQKVIEQISDRSFDVQAVA
jgi:hypothetical protein